MTVGRNRCLASVLLVLVAGCLLFPPLARAEEKSLQREIRPFFLQPEARFRLDFESNALQSPSGESDTVAKLIGGLLAVYDFPNHTQLIGQYQYQVWRYNRLSLFNISLHVGNLLIGHRLSDPLNLFDSVEPYLGVQMVAALPSLAPGANRFDVNLLAGLTLIKVWGADRLLLLAFNLNNLQADVRPTAYTGQAVNVLYRQALTGRLSVSAGAQVQARWPMQAGVANVLRNNVELEFLYYPWNWLTLELGSGYTYDLARAPERRMGFFSFGIGMRSNLGFNW